MERNVFTLREYEYAEIGDRWSPADRVVPARVVAALERMQAGNRAKVFEISRRYLKAQQYVGTVCIEGCAIDVLPKVDTTDSETRENLLAMLQIAGLVPTLDTGISSLAESNASLLEMLLRTYVEKLRQEWRRGHIAGFLRIERNRPHLRGKLQLAEHVRRNLHHPWRLYTGADEFVEDVPLSRLLKLGLHVCRAHGTLDRTRRDAVQLLGEFDEVADSDFTSEELDRLAVNRQSSRFGPLVELAKMIARGRVPDRAGLLRTYSIAFDMNVVFERLIGNLLRRYACPETLRVRLQVGGRALLRKGAGGQFWLRPDVGLFRGSQAVCLLDTKWKRLDPSRPYDGVSQADMYQMYAYGKEFEAPVVVTLYPRAEGFAADVAAYRHQPGDPEAPRILISTVDVGARTLADIGDRPSIRSQLRELMTRVRADAS